MLINLLIYCSLAECNCCLILNCCLNFFQHFLCFSSFIFYFLPGFLCIIILIESFYFFKCCFQCCCINCGRICWSHNIGSCCIKLKCIVLISQCINGQFPVTCSICSCRKLASYRMCQTKLNSHLFMHPVISSKFRTICCKYCITISIVIPFNCLHCSTKTTIITIQIHTKEFSIRSTCCFNLWLNSSCNFEISSLNTGFCSCFSCTEREASIFILSYCFQSICVYCYICSLAVCFQIVFRETTNKYFTIFYYRIFCCKICIIFSFYLYRDIFNTCYCIMIKAFFRSAIYLNRCRSTSLSICRSPDCNCSICKNRFCTALPVR